MLGLQAEAITMLIHLATFAGDGAVEKITRVKLDAGFGGINLQDSAAGWFIYLGG